MPTRRSLAHLGLDRTDIPFKQLCAIANKVRPDPPDDIEWKHRIKAHVWSDGFRLPPSRTVYKAIDAITFTTRRIRSAAPQTPPVRTPDPRPWPVMPRARGPQDFTPLAALCPPPPSPICGCSKPISGRTPLTCDRETGHEGDHGVRNVAGELIVRWSR
jgi:hypothetical protein